MQRGWAGDSVRKHKDPPPQFPLFSLLVVFNHDPVLGGQSPSHPCCAYMSPINRAACIFVCVHPCILITGQPNNPFFVTQRCYRHAVFAFAHLLLESLSLIALDTLPCRELSHPICLTHCGQSGALFPYFA